MERCPRCDAAVDQLHAVPAEKLRERAGSAAGTVTGSRVCRTCLHEIREG